NIAWFENAGGQGPWPRRDLGQADYVHKIHAADMDGDGDLDIVFSEQLEARNPRVGVFHNRDGGEAWDLGVVAGRGAHNIAVDDVGGDGDLDILGADWREDTRLLLWENVGG
ncbi:MAG TPA: VCBS repeat-containing protein, partial [Fibrobacteria bacterium]|nr:VCBS repeat-containing protein [Fibrobacteria bacterium]